eukprot:3636627-Rhodomonas_salina.1
MLISVQIAACSVIDVVNDLRATLLISMHIVLTLTLLLVRARIVPSLMLLLVSLQIVEQLFCIVHA